MQSVSRRYLKEIYDKWKYGATWTPGKKRRLGDVGVFNEGVFDRKAHLENFGIEFDELEDSSPVNYDHISSTGVEIDWKAKGESTEGFQALSKVEAGARIKFTERNAILFSASNCVEHEIKNKIALERALLDRAKQHNSDWLEEYAVITDTVVADSVTILISGSSDAAVELKAMGDLGSSWMKIAGLNSQVKEVHSKNMEMSIIAEGPITPLFNSLRMKRGFIEKLWALLQGESSDDSVEAEDPLLEGLDVESIERIAADSDGERLFNYANEDDEFLNELFEEVDISQELTQ